VSGAAQQAQAARARLGLALDGPVPDLLRAVEDGGELAVSVIELPDGISGAYARREGQSTDSPIPRTTADLATTVRELLGNRPQRELAELLGLDASAVSRALAGKRALGLGEIVDIADYLGVEPSHLLFRDEAIFALRAGEGTALSHEAERRCLQIINDVLAFRTVAK